MKKDIRALSIEDLGEICRENGQPLFRAKQIYEWLWAKAVFTFDEMTNLPKAFRSFLQENYVINNITINTRQVSNDGTIKFTFRLFDNHLIEGVIIPTDTRLTACVSSQVGCSLSCSFCATGFMGRKRNLNFDEIFDQYIIMNQEAMDAFGKPLTNIVYMGMGEPLLNYANVLKSIDFISNPETINFSPKRITVSTAGIAKMIKKLADDEVRFNLALSLHAPNDVKRDKIMPINSSNNLETLIESLLYFYQNTGNKMTFEYILLKDFNDTNEDAHELIKLCQRVPAIINVIEYNQIDEADFEKTSESSRDKFITLLERNRVTAKVRKSRGKDIDAACGQLANKTT